MSSFLDQDLTQILLEKIGSLSKELDSTRRILKWKEREAERTIVNAQQSIGFISLLERLENKQQLTREDSSFILYSMIEGDLQTKTDTIYLDLDPGILYFLTHEDTLSRANTYAILQPFPYLKQLYSIGKLKISSEIEDSLSTDEELQNINIIKNDFHGE